MARGSTNVQPWPASTSASSGGSGRRQYLRRFVTRSRTASERGSGSRCDGRVIDPQYPREQIRTGALEHGLEAAHESVPAGDERGRLVEGTEREVRVAVVGVVRQILQMVVVQFVVAVRGGNELPRLAMCGDGERNASARNAACS